MRSQKDPDTRGRGYTMIVAMVVITNIPQMKDLVLTWQTNVSSFVPLSCLVDELLLMFHNSDFDQSLSLAIRQE